MARQLRLEFPGAIYHLTSRGNGRQDIFLDDDDRVRFLTILAETVTRYNWNCHAYVLMGNHYHLLVETPAPNLSLGMRHLNGVYTQSFNRCHQLAGHVFQGRYKSILVEKDAHLLELCRHLVLNPVRVGCTDSPEKWCWSSYRATAGEIPVPDFLHTLWVLRQFDRKKEEGQEQYHSFVRDGILVSNGISPWNQLQGQIFFGSKAFVERIKDKLLDKRSIIEIPREQRFAGRPPLEEFLGGVKDRRDRDMRIYEAHVHYGYTLVQIADELGLHYTTVSRVAKKQREMIQQNTA